jgi:diketogulonate reductase-like aldo/keto reductase
MVPEIGLGTWKYRGGVEPLRCGIELGAFLIDTAEMYRTEDQVGEAVRGRRDRVFIATKVLGSHLRRDQLLRAAENSLRLLNVDCIDLYQIHWPNSSVPIKETMGAMESLVDSGQVRYIGVSNFSVRELEEARSAMSKYPIVSNQVLYNLRQRSIEPDLIPYCQQHDITVIAYTPLADGSLTRSSGHPGGIRRAAGRVLGREGGTEALQEVADAVGRTPAQVALNWCIAKPNVIAIPKSNSVERTRENCAASGWRLSAEQLRTLEEAFPR